MNKCVLTEVVGQAGARTSFVPRQVENPRADAVGDSQPPIASSLLKGLQIGLSYEGRPDNSGLVARDASAAARVVECVAPTVLRVSPGLMTIQPVEADLGFCEIVLITSRRET